MLHLKPSKCKTCQTLRAKFVLWLGTFLGVMTPLKEKNMEQPEQPQGIAFGQDQIAAIIGNKEIEIIGLRIQVARLTAELESLRGKPTLREVKG